MQISIEVPADRIANMMASAVESGDPVTRDWCSDIMAMTATPTDKAGPWYAAPAFWEGDFTVEIIEDDEGQTTTHTVRPADMVRGLTIMATKFPGRFSQILEDNTDAPCADIFLQCVLFGEEKYA